MENMKTVVEWAETQFGPAGSALSIAVRTNVEMAELLAAFSNGAPLNVIEMEIGDVLVMMLQIFAKLKAEREVSPKSGAVVSQAYMCALFANAQFAHVLVELNKEGADPSGVLTSLDATHWSICQTAKILKLEPQRALDMAMAKNRSRTYARTENGRYQHVEEPAIDLVEKPIPAAPALKLPDITAADLKSAIEFLFRSPQLKQYGRSVKAVMAAQWILESSWGRSGLAKEHFNYAGMKYRDYMHRHCESVLYRAHDGLEHYCSFPSPESFVLGYIFRLNNGPYAGWQDAAIADDAEGFMDAVLSTWVGVNAKAYRSNIRSIVNNISM